MQNRTVDFDGSFTVQWTPAGGEQGFEIEQSSSANSNWQVIAAVAANIEKTVDGASVTTAADLADRVSGTLVDAKNLASKLGTALSVVGLLAAFLIASLLTLSSVTKRFRELGTLKALGWSQGLFVRQVTGESLIQGLLGGALGVLFGILGAVAITALTTLLILFAMTGSVVLPLKATLSNLLTLSATFGILVDKVFDTP